MTGERSRKRPSHKTRKLPEETLAFLTTVAPDGEWLFFAKTEGPTDWHDDHTRHYDGTADGTVSALLDANNDGCAIYLTINRMSGHRRHAIDATHVRCLFIDQDCPADPEDWRALLDSDTPPHAIVQTSPGKFSAFWRVDNVALDEFTPLQRAMVERFCSDPSVCDLPRLMRVPGLMHWKTGLPIPSTTLYLDEKRPAYTRKNLVEGLALEPASEHKGRSQDAEDWTAGIEIERERVEQEPARIKFYTEALHTISPDCNRDTWMRVVMAWLAAGLSEDVIEAWSSCSDKHSVREWETLVRSCRDEGRHGKRVHLGTLVHVAEECDFDAAETRDRLGLTLEGEELKKDTDSGQFILSPLDLSKGAELPPVSWAIRPLIPRSVVTLGSGHGGVGKSMLAATLAAHVGCGREWAGLDTEAGRVLYLSAEDSLDIVRFRLSRIADAYDLPTEMIERNVSLAYAEPGKPRALAMEKRGSLAMTALFDQLAEMVTGMTLVILDNASHLYLANENDRAQVTTFLQRLDGLASKTGAAILLLAHIDKSAARGGSNGQSFSGSTAWHNSSRSRIAITESKTPDFVEVAHEKANLSKRAETIMLKRGTHGVLEVLGADSPGRDNSDREAIIELMQEAARSGVNVPARLAPGNHSAMSVLETLKGCPDRFKGKPGRDRMRLVMTWLQQGGSLRECEYKDASRHVRTRFEVVNIDEDVDSA